LGYEFSVDELSYGLKKEGVPVPEELNKPYFVFLHGTTWASKHWPNSYWETLVALVADKGFAIYLPWGSEQEKQRAQQLADVSAQAFVLPRSSIKELSAILMHAKGVVGVDSGLAHLTAACGTPLVSIYGSTNAVLTGTLGENNQSLQTQFACSPCLKKDCSYSKPSAVTPACYESVPPGRVFDVLLRQMA
jgi:heptosyltransferase-1